MRGSGRARRWGTALAIGLVVGTYSGGVQQAVAGLLGGDRWNWAEMAVHVVAWGLLMEPAVRLGRWVALRHGPAARVRDRRARLVAPAMASGVLPPDADPDVWRRALRDEEQEWSGARWLAVVLAGPGAGVVGLAAVRANDGAPGVWAVAGLVAAAGSVAFRSSDRRLAVARRLLAELPTREPRS